MLRTIDRYVIREVIPPFLLSLLIFTFILEIPPVMQHLETLVAKGVTWQIAVQIIITLIPQALGITIPMALLTGILIGLGRLSADRETVALLACGVSPFRLLRPLLLLAVLATAASLYVLIEAIPNANQAFNRIAYEIITKRVEEDIRPRVFFEDFPGWVLYSRDEAGSGGGWKDVLVADTRNPKATQLFLASRGRLYLAPDMSRVDLILSDGAQYGTGNPGETTVGHFAGDLILGLDPKTVFPRMELPRGITEKTIPELQQTIQEKRLQQEKLNAAGQDFTMSPHPEILGIHQKFSLPAACLVFALIGLALGLSVARDGKMAGFVIGIVVIFAYYIVMYLGESAVKGYYTTPASVEGSMYLAHLGRWLPNILLGAFGIAAIIWRARYAERGLPIRIPAGLSARLPTGWGRTASPSTPDSPAGGSAQPPFTRRKVVVVVRFPRMRLPAVGVLDRYILGIYFRTIGLAFLALLGLFHISTFIDRADKMFKGEASMTMMVELLALMTPQFVYFVIPIAALLSALVTFGLLARTSELTVMKACGISLYRIAVPIVVVSLGWSVLLFGLEQEMLAAANRRAEVLDNTIRGRPTTTFDPLNRRWLIGTDGAIYHYSYFDPERQTLNGLSIYRLPPDNSWRLASHTYAPRVVYSGTEWLAETGWTQDLTTTPPRWAPFGRRSIPIEPPDYFHTEQPTAELMTVGELRQVVTELEASGFNAIPARVELQRKLAFPFVALVMTLLAIPFGVTTGRRGAIYGIGIGIVIALMYWVIFSIFIALGRAGILSPPLAAWTPNIIVFASAIYLFLTAKT